MPDQSKAPRVGEPPGSARSSRSLTVPAVIVDDLRDGAYAELGSAANEIDCAVCNADRDAHPDRCISQLEYLDAARALLEVFGWSRTVPPVDVRIELPGNQGVFLAVLDGAVAFAEDDLREVERREAELAARGQAPQHDAPAKRIEALRVFAASVCSQADMPGAEEERAK